MADPCFRLRLLGDFQLFADNDPLVLGQPRLEELLAFLAIQPDIHFPRAQIAYLFWPDSSEKQALVNTRGLIHKLKKAWPDVDQAIVMERSHLAWRRDSPVLVDLHAFTRQEQLARTNQQDAAARRTAMQQAMELYGGDLVPACYSDWLLAAREDLRARYASLLDNLAEDAVAQRNTRDALRWAEALRVHDPLRESTYRRLMEIHALLDDRAAALRVYHQCASLLQNELGVEPSQPLQALHDQLLNHTAPPPDRSAGPKAAERAKLVGRHREWQQLQHAWQAATQGRAQFVVIWGEAGIGKSRLAEELIDWVRRLGHGWASSRSYAARGALTYAPITEWLRAQALAGAVQSIDDLWRVEAARLLPELLADRPDLPAPGPLNENWQQQRFYQSIVQILQEASGPLLLHLDDMQWSDRETLALLHFLFHGAQHHPLLIVGTIRTEDAIENEPLMTLLQGLRHNHQLAELKLGPLAEDEVMSLAEQTAGRALAPALADRLYTASEGHPLFLIETVRSGLDAATPSVDVLDDGALQNPLPAGIPPRIFQLLATRLSQLSTQAQEIAATAAVIGRAFSYPVLHAVSSLEEMVLIDGLDELWSRRIIREQEADAYDFTHDRIRETAYLQISRARRRVLHRRVAQALETIHSGALEAVAAELAAHFAQAGEADAAFHYYRMAADVALNTYALSSAEEMLLAALDQVDDQPIKQIETRIRLSRIYADTFQFSAWQENLTCIEALLHQLPTPDQRLRIEYMLSYARYCEFSGRQSQGLENARQAVQTAEDLGEPDLLARAYCELGTQYWGQTRMVDARRAYERCVDHARTDNSRPVLANALEMLAATGMFSGMSSGRISALLMQSLRLARATDDKHQISSLYNKFGYLPVAQGTGGFETAEEAYEYGLTLAQETRDRKLEEIILANLIVLNTQRGDYRRALETYRMAADIGQDESNRLFFWVKHHYQAAALMQMGVLVSAQRQLEAACNQLRRLKKHHFEVKARSDLGLLLHLAGKQQEARDELHALLELISGHGDLRFEALVNTRLGYVYEALAQPEDALRVYARGHELHQAMEQSVYAQNALAGTARILAVQGETAAAYTTATTVWANLTGRETDATVESIRSLRTCYQVFHAQGDPCAHAALEAACAQLNRRAASIDDPAHLAAFWQLEDHRFFAHIRQPEFAPILS